MCACGRVSRRRRALTRAESNNSREYVRPRYESLDTTERSFPPRVTHARACERTRAYNRVKFDNKAGKLWTECLPRVDNTRKGVTYHSFFPKHISTSTANLLILEALGIFRCFRAELVFFDFWKNFSIARGTQRNFSDTLCNSNGIPANGIF